MGFKPRKALRGGTHAVGKSGKQLTNAMDNAASNVAGSVANSEKQMAKAAAKVERKIAKQAEKNADKAKHNGKKADKEHKGGMSDAEAKHKYAGMGHYNKAKAGVTALTGVAGVTAMGLTMGKGFHYADKIEGGIDEGAQLLLNGGKAAAEEMEKMKKEAARRERALMELAKDKGPGVLNTLNEKKDNLIEAGKWGGVFLESTALHFAPMILVSVIFAYGAYRYLD